MFALAYNCWKTPIHHPGLINNLLSELKEVSSPLSPALTVMYSQSVSVFFCCCFCCLAAVGKHTVMRDNQNTCTLSSFDWMHWAVTSISLEFETNKWTVTPLLEKKCTLTRQEGPFSPGRGKLRSRWEADAVWLEGASVSCRLQSPLPCCSVWPWEAAARDAVCKKYIYTSSHPS